MTRSSTLPPMQSSPPSPICKASVAATLARPWCFSSSWAPHWNLVNSSARGGPAIGTTSWRTLAVSWPAWPWCAFSRGSLSIQQPMDCVNHISDHDLERHYLGMITDNPGSAPLEEHRVACPACVEPAESTQDYANDLRAASLLPRSDPVALD